MIFEQVWESRKINAANNFIKKKQIVRDVKTIVEYIVFNFKNVVSNDYKNRITFISSKLKNVELKRKDERLIENVLKIVFFENKYVSSLNIRSILLFDKKITTLFKKSLMNAFNTFTLFFQIVRFIFSKFIQFVVYFLNLSSQSVLKKNRKANKKSFTWKTEIVSCERKNTVIVKDCCRSFSNNR